MKIIIAILLVFISIECLSQTPLKSKVKIIGNYFSIGELEIAEYDYPYYIDWEDAAALVNDLGDGWRIPTKSELLFLYKHRETLKFGQKSKYDEREYQGGYWSSTIKNSKIYVLDLLDGKTSVYAKKNNDASLRIVRNSKKASQNKSKTEYEQTPLPIIIDTVISKTGRIWMSKNLGAQKKSSNTNDIKSYGDLFQWDRISDGHEKRFSINSKTTSINYNTLSKNFIVSPTGEWLRSNMIYIKDGLPNLINVCPAGFDIPSISEWEEEIATWEEDNGAFKSPLKLPLAGYRDYTNGKIKDEGKLGVYWSSSGKSFGANAIGFLPKGSAFIANDRRANGFSIRCIKSKDHINTSAGN